MEKDESLSSKNCIINLAAVRRMLGSVRLRKDVWQVLITETWQLTRLLVAESQKEKYANMRARDRMGAAIDSVLSTEGKYWFRGECAKGDQSRGVVLKVVKEVLRECYKGKITAGHTDPVRYACNAALHVFASGARRDNPQRPVGCEAARGYYQKALR